MNRRDFLKGLAVLPVLHCVHPKTKAEYTTCLWEATTLPNTYLEVTTRINGVEVVNFAFDVQGLWDAQDDRITFYCEDLSITDLPPCDVEAVYLVVKDIGRWEIWQGFVTIQEFNTLNIQWEHTHELLRSRH